MRINVEYPLMETIKPDSRMKQVEGFTVTSINVPVNRVFRVNVNTSKIYDEVKHCLLLTGMTPTDYQARFKQAWND